MNIHYHQSLYPLIECIGFIEYYEAQYDYRSKSIYIESNLGDTLKALEQIKIEFGKQAERSCGKLKPLLIQIPNHNTSILKKMILECTNELFPSWKTQLRDIKQKVLSQDHFILRCTAALCEEEHEEQWAECDLNALIEQLEACEFNDDLKWQLFHLNAHSEEVMEQVEKLFIDIMPIYQKYETQLNHIMNDYYKDYETYRSQLYDQFVNEKGISFESKYQDTLLIPSVAYSFSLFVGESFLIEPKRTSILWGVHILRADQVNRNSVETICSGLKTLSDRSKFEILCFLSKNQRAYGAQIAKAMKLTTATISYHMQALIDAGLVSVEKDNNRLYFQVHKEHLHEYLKQVEQKILHP